MQEAGLSEKTSLMFYDRESAPVFFFPCRFHLNSTLLVGGNAGEGRGKIMVDKSLLFGHARERASHNEARERERERDVESKS